MSEKLAAERKRFEAWLMTQKKFDHLAIKRSEFSGRYIDQEVEWMWRGWCAKSMGELSGVR